MKNTLKYFSVAVILLLYSLAVFAQKDKIKAEEAELQTIKEDTTRVKTLAHLAKIFCMKSQYDSSIHYSTLALNLSQKIDYPYGLAIVYGNFGTIYSDEGNFPEALRNFFKSLQIAEERGIKRVVAGNYNNMGAVYYYMGDYPEALKDYIQTMKIEKEIGDTQQIANTYNNMGNIYSTLNNYDEAMHYYQLLLKNGEITKNKKLIEIAYDNMGVVQKGRGNYQQALEYERLALKIALENNEKKLIASVYAALGDIYSNQKKYDSSLVKYRQALKTYKQLSDKTDMGMTYCSIGNDYCSEKNYPLAREYEDSSLIINKELGAKLNLRQVYSAFSTIDSAEGNYAEAVKNYKLYTIYRDSISNEENTRKMLSEQLSYEFDKKHIVDSLQFASESKIETINLNKQKIFTILGFIGMALLLIFAAFIFRSLRLSHRQRALIEKGKKRSDDLLLNILPAETAEELKSTGVAKAKRFEQVSVMFTDIKNFTLVSETMNPEDLVNEINYCYSEFDKIVSRNHVEKIKTIGDGYMAAGGLPVENSTNPVDTVNAALDIVNFMREETRRRKLQNKPYFEVRIGIHTGPVVAGVVGLNKFAYDIWGDTVNTASRMESSGEAGKVNISGATYELVKGKFTCTYRGKVQAKNKGEIDMYFVEA